MQGDRIIVEASQLRLAEQLVARMWPSIQATAGRYAVTVAGESGSGKSTIAVATAQTLEQRGKRCVILQQDDYYVHPAKTNDATRRKDPNWYGPREVRLDFLDQQVRQILDGAAEIVKPLSIYAEDRFDEERIATADVDVVVVEGTYVTLLNNAQAKIFIDRNYMDTRAFREKRARDAAELDAFTENIIQKEHEIVVTHKALATLVIGKNWEIFS